MCKLAKMRDTKQRYGKVKGYQEWKLTFVFIVDEEEIK